MHSDAPERTSKVSKSRTKINITFIRTHFNHFSFYLSFLNSICITSIHRPNG